MCEKCPNAGKYGPEKTPNSETFHAVSKKRVKFLAPCIGVSFH